MYILHIASEMAPIAKVGGLADVVSGLSKELKWKDNLVEVILPKYDCLDWHGVKDLKVAYENLASFYKGQWINNTVWEGTVDGVVVFFIEPHDEWNFFRRGTFYNCPDNLERFTYFTRAALEFLLKSGRTPDVLHCHDWHTALAPVLFYEIFQPIGLRSKKIVFTIHNLYHQGLCDPWIIDAIGLSSRRLHQFDRLQDETRPELLNLLKGAIVFSNAVTTVSPTYALEIQTTLGGAGLDRVLRQYSRKLIGILNGIDTSYWNPELDPMLPYRYSSSDPKHFFEKKGQCTEALQTRLHLTRRRPIISTITRLVPQKGIDLIHHALFRTLELGGQFVLMGTSPDPEISDRFHRLKMDLASNPHVRLELHHNEELAHQIYAGSDAFIIPSIFEPCGLTQQIALKYGTVPIARRTGGLNDTIFDSKNGFTFDHADNGGMNWGLDRAVRLFKEYPSKWQEIALRGAKQDLSWRRPAAEYLALYLKD